MVPTLLSLGENSHAAARDADKLVEQGWLSRNEPFAFWPTRVNPPGLVSKRDSDDWRRISDTGAPRCFQDDGAGGAIRSLNDAGDVNRRGTSGERLNPREIKPFVHEVVEDAATIMCGAQLLGLRIFGLVDGFKAYFYQFVIHPSKYWRLNFVLAGSTGVPLVYTDLVMSMGLSVVTNLVQRLSNAVIRHVLTLFDAEEEPIFAAIERDPDTPNEYRAWAEGRRRLAARFGVPCLLRLHSGFAFTDDNILLAAGEDRLARLLLCWLLVAERFRLHLADAAKLFIGQYLPYISVALLLSLDVTCIPPAKIARALECLTRVAGGPAPTNAEMRSLDGLLVSFASARRLPANMMYAMHASHGEHTLESSVHITRTLAMMQAAKSWIAFLERTVAATWTTQRRRSSGRG
ncbi:hypothetical protein T492DRAFT_835505 [Pavlovales sp. CCMP2436]|nr:hypothetical protein T492DRAFT_835505 [Pavlovales sp. CCMP2436]